jgi:uncharacterized membrane protein
MNKKILISIIIVISFIIGIYFYPLMPEKMASHWNFQGQADGYASKEFGLFFFPVFLLAMVLILLFVPKIDPLKNNIEKFKDSYERFIALFSIFFVYIYCLTILWNIGISFNMNVLLMPALALLFYYMGVLLKQAKRNYFIGIRTPWTLSSDVVWDKTHDLGEKLFKLIGLFTLVSVFFPKYAFVFILIPIIIFPIYLVVYSYYEFKKQK